MKRLLLALVLALVGCGEAVDVGPSTGGRVVVAGGGGSESGVGGAPASSGGSSGDPACSTTWLWWCGGMRTGNLDCGSEGSAVVWEDGVEFWCEGTPPNVDCSNASLESQRRCVGFIQSGSGGEQSGGGGTNSGGSVGAGGGCSEQEWCLDDDQDGYVDTSACSFACVAPSSKHRANRGIGVDCYDSNAQAQPNPTISWRNTDRGDGSFDWNCDGVEEPEFKTTGSCLQYGIPDREGWVGSVPTCGATGKFVVFDVDDNCYSSSGVDRVNRCR